ncbi:molybdopterin synthase sulfur carrier subunit [Carbonactinospora thermoautotrophica]|uniref:ubiquitin-like small modifier protein 1 n=1 Tax=Carbonactinospora thermoautotrophica TaxID=1469144 RepID=UPI00226EAD76|nr:ubiquitin-like small modifier protein 1 [Carbonactinospora thermoautotrophica]MCX9192278.1 molybdopterin synthase sulfur carrier subunit [Carbonactinospora thermoautotrophica]
MTVTVRLPSVLREFAGGRPTVAVPDGATVGDVLDRLAADLPALERRIRDERGVIRRHVNVFVGETNVRDAAGLATSAPDGAEVVVIPAVSGG